MISTTSILRLWSLWDMLQSYFPVYQLALGLQRLRTAPELLDKFSRTTKLTDSEKAALCALFEKIELVCTEMGFTHTADLSKKTLARGLPDNHADARPILDLLNDSLSFDLQQEAAVRIPPSRKAFYEDENLFGEDVLVAFPSCKEDIRRAGTCYALEQGDGCVYHLMLVLERGLRCLAAKVNVPFDRANWQLMIDGIGKEIRLLPASPQKHLYQHANSQFFHLKNTYRNHSAHVHEFPYDVETALSTLNHVRSFMQDLARGGLSE